MLYSLLEGIEVCPICQALKLMDRMTKVMPARKCLDADYPSSWVLIQMDA